MYRLPVGPTPFDDIVQTVPHGHFGFGTLGTALVERIKPIIAVLKSNTSSIGPAGSEPNKPAIASGSMSGNFRGTGGGDLM
ncbi:hypothetical protein MDN60_002704 [Salmonella enterica]|nr:hypothetical protein [Salmonella enterica]EID3924317.1 hypothetical protein [Salmonella enterica]EID7413038.1 hypothetical protein [Salmonella enterica]EIL4708212.1 hypothetical protein [Salmonella enterica]EIW4274087.1 hypothetical protein [Salmonella enterica]